MEQSESKPEKLSLMTNKTFLSVFGALFALILIILLILINVATQMDDVDEKLKYMPPQTNGSKVPSGSIVSGQTIFVPIYSHIYAQGGKPFLLEATLSIRNTDSDNEITINYVRYYDTKGKLIKNHLEKPIQLNPLATAEFLVEQKKNRGGFGRKFYRGMGFRYRS